MLRPEQTVLGPDKTTVLFVRTRGENRRAETSMRGKWDPCQVPKGSGPPVRAELSPCSCACALLTVTLTNLSHVFPKCCCPGDRLAGTHHTPPRVTSLLHPVSDTHEVPWCVHTSLQSTFPRDLSQPHRLWGKTRRGAEAMTWRRKVTCWSHCHPRPWPQAYGTPQHLPRGEISHLPSICTAGLNRIDYATVAFHSEM